ncbi:hypothetical protein HMPREF1868_01443 [Olsenella sp. DNF00959]|nr:hypothetical protein HMPREF1868_01443 [Olsenella sp. DNF00959]
MVCMSSVVVLVSQILVMFLLVGVGFWLYSGAAGLLAALGLRSSRATGGASRGGAGAPRARWGCDSSCTALLFGGGPDTPSKGQIQRSADADGSHALWRSELRRT